MLFETLHVYLPLSVTVRVWVYCAVTGSFNTVSAPSVMVLESLVQVTVVAGPPVEIQVRMNEYDSAKSKVNVIRFGVISTLPKSKSNSVTQNHDDGTYNITSIISIQSNIDRFSREVIVDCLS